MEDDVIQVAVGLHLGVALCAPHQCRHCRVLVDQHSTHGLHCPFSSGSHSRHAALNDIIKGLLTLQRSPAIWNLQVSIVRMASDQMELQLFLGGVGKSWCGMAPAQTR